MCVPANSTEPRRRSERHGKPDRAARDLHARPPDAVCGQTSRTPSVSHTDGEALHRLLFSDRLPRRADYSNFVIDIEIERQGLFISQGRNHVIELTCRKINNRSLAAYVCRAERDRL